ncbi:unnamed protein product [Gemmataceae bacterium]|nr:unnamed protein product [Gemmataceae bacterium]VTU02150.1 unnamed protein product [Gemmataceae bacterium]
MIVACILAFGPAPAFAQDAEVTLTLTPAASTIATGDPLLLKAVLRNCGKAAVKLLDGRFDSFSFGVQFEVKPPDSKVFGRVLSTDQGRFCGIVRPDTMDAGQVLACFSTLFAGEVQGTGVQLFSAPGTWEIRARTDVDGQRMVSEPVSITVVAREKKATEALADRVGSVYACVRFRGGAEPEKLAAALEIRELLGTSELGRVIDEAVLLRRLAETDAARPRARVRADVARHRDGLSTVAREHFDLWTAGVLLARKEYDAARKLIDAAPKGETCWERSKLLGRLLTELAPPK